MLGCDALDLDAALFPVQLRDGVRARWGSQWVTRCETALLSPSSLLSPRAPSSLLAHEAIRLLLCSNPKPFYSLAPTGAAWAQPTSPLPPPGQVPPPHPLPVASWMSF